VSGDGTQPLPPGWAWTTLGAIAEIKGGVTKGQKRRPGEVLRAVPYLRVANVQRGYLDLGDTRTIEATEAEIEELRLMPNDVLLNEGGDRDKLGRGWVWRGEIAECIHQNHVFRARLRSPDVQPKLVSWYGNSFGQQYFMDEGKQTTNLASINLTKLSAFLIPLPPAAEQQRIVAAIEQHFSRLDAAVAALERTRANLKRYRASVLMAACEGRLVPTEAELARDEGREYESAAQLLARADGKSSRLRGRSELPEVPEGWAWATWEQLARRVTVGHVGPMKHEYLEDGVPFLRSQNVRENRFDPVGLLHIPSDFHRKLQKSVLHPGDLVVVRSGSVGVTCVIPEGFPEANCADLVLIQGPVGIEPRYGSFYTNSLARQFVRAGQVGIALTHFNTKSVAALPVALPPLAEQRRIVAEVERRLSVVEELEATVSANLKRAERLRQAILRRAFAGELVPQDPSDEPASVLLERNRTERDGAAPAARGRGKRRIAPARQQPAPTAAQVAASPTRNGRFGRVVPEQAQALRLFDD
jgi:type I restriction enzyme S subunit